jgi:hypothetical protein
MNEENVNDAIAPRSVDQQRLVRTHWITALRGYAEPDPPYRSRFNFVWWFWLPRLHTQRPDAMNPRVIRLIWLCFAVGLDIWGKESRMYWPNKPALAASPAKNSTEAKDSQNGN